MWEGTEWQDYCLMLLHRRYADHTLQEVPDSHGGDLGIEAYSLDGCAFQCYAAEEPLSVSALYERQRDKLTTDLGKLKKNAKDLKKILGDLEIAKYVFMVPRHESRYLLEHANTKAEEVRTWGLSFIAPDFRIMVVTDEDYAAERLAIVAIPEPLVAGVDVTPTDHAAWVLANAALTAKAAGKLRIFIDEDDIPDALESLVYQFLGAENSLQKLRERYPDHWTAVQSCKSRKQTRLPLEYPASINTSMSIVPGLQAALAQELGRDAPSIAGRVAEAIAWGAVAEWIMNCPLKFKAA
jgi:hypothetical protein